MHPAVATLSERLFFGIGLDWATDKVVGASNEFASPAGGHSHGKSL